MKMGILDVMGKFKRKIMVGTDNFVISDAALDIWSTYFVRVATIVLILMLVNLDYRPAFSVTMIVFALAVGFFCYHHKVLPKFGTPAKVSQALWIFFVVLYVCAFFAGNVRGNYGGAFEQLYRAFPFFMLLSLRSLVDVRREIKYSLAVVAIVQFFIMRYDFIVRRIPRPDGFLSNANNSAELIGLVLPFFVYHAFCAKDWRQRFFWFMVSALDFLALCMTRCRGELIALVLVLLFFIPWIVQRYSKDDILLAVIADILILSVGYYLFNWRGNSDMHRIYVYESTIKMWWDHFFFGVGLGDWRTVYNSGYRLKTEVQDLVHAHNMYLMFLSMTGVVGTMAFVNVVVRFYQNFVQQIKQNRMYYVVGFVGVTLFLIHGIVDSTYTYKYTARFVWLMLAVYLIEFTEQNNDGCVA